MPKEPNNEVAIVGDRTEHAAALMRPPQVVSPIGMGGVNIGALFEEAVKQGSAMEVIKELRLMESDHAARKAKAEFDAALSAFQTECPIIKKEKAVPDRSGAPAYRYAPIETIEVQIRPFCQKHGFSHTFDTDTNSAQGWVISKCIVKHTGGHECVSTGKFPLGTKTGIMSDTQVYAAALTFANRRALCNAYGLILAGEDLDGRTLARNKPPGPQAQAQDEVATLKTELWNLLKPVRGSKADWNEANNWLWRNEILDAAANEKAPVLSAERLELVIAEAREVLGN